jgi:hypothetical protein
MDPSFEKFLLECGVGKTVVQVLQNQKIFSIRVFRAMQRSCEMLSLLYIDLYPSSLPDELYSLC